MSKLAESLAVDLTGYQPMSKPPLIPTQGSSLEPVFNSMLRCPLPPVSVSPDSLRQFYIGGQVPQMRILTPPSSVQGSGNTTINQTTVVTGSSSGGGSSVISIVATTASITTNQINPNNNFIGSLLMAKSFQLLTLNANSPCRIRLYSNATAQSLDLSRALDVSPNPGTTQNLISDVVLDTLPLQFSLQNRIGANADSPQKTSIYITVTNLDAISEAITVTIGYVPLEN